MTTYTNWNEFRRSSHNLFQSTNLKFILTDGLEPQSLSKDSQWSGWALPTYDRHATSSANLLHYPMVLQFRLGPILICNLN